MDRWIECLGGFCLTQHGARVPLPMRKAQILLAMLAVARRQSAPRTRIAALLWEHADGESARVSLRQTLAQVRRAAGAGLIEADGDILRLGDGVGSDIAAFADALARGDDAHAARLYSGPFLDGALPGGPDLDAAVSGERARLGDLATGALRREIERLADRPEAVQAAHRLLSLDPLDESAHRLLMQTDAARGARGAARARFDFLRDTLRRDLGAAPDEETVALMDRIRRAGATGRTDARAETPPAPPSDTPALILVALEGDGAPDWSAFGAAVEAAQGRVIESGTGERVALWENAPLRSVAIAALDLAGQAGGTLSFGLVPAHGRAAGADASPSPRAVGQARRIAARADPGQVWVAADLAPRLGLAGDGSAPVPLSPNAIASRPDTPIVGRELELAQIDSALAAARASGRGLAVHLSGEAGIGKSRLVAEIARRESEAGSLVARVGFEPLARATTHIAQALMAQLPALPESATTGPTMRALLAWLVGEPLGPETDLRLSALSSDARRSLLIDILTVTFARAADAEKVLLIIEDCHWAAPGIADFLLDLCDRLNGIQVVLIMTERPYEADLGRRLAARARLGVVRLSLGPLGSDAAIRLATSTTTGGRDISGALERAAGHPLFLLRLLEAGWSAGDLPQSITDLVLEQIERLPPAEHAALSRAAILGAVIEPGVTAAIWPDIAAPRPRGDLLHATGKGLAFGHDLIRQAIYNAIPDETRQMWHGQAAAHYRHTDPLRWADHALLAKDDADAARAATAAANAMIGQMRLAAAAGYIEAGLGRGSDPEAVAELHSCLAGIRRTRGDLRGALAAYHDAHAAAASDATRVAMLVRQALVLHRLGRGAEADRALDTAEDLADRIGLGGLGRAEIHEQRGNRAFVTGDAAECLSQHQRGRMAAEVTGDPRGIARAHGGLGDAHVLSGRLRTAYGHFETAVSMAANAGLGMVHQDYACMRGYTLLFAEPGPKAHLLADLAVEATAEANADRAEMLARIVRAELRLTALDLDGAREDTLRIAVLMERDPEPRFAADLALMQAWLALREGDRMAAFRRVEPHLQDARDSPYNGPILLGLGALCAPDETTQQTLLSAAETRLAAGAMATTAIGFYSFAIELAATVGNEQNGRRYCKSLRKLTATEPLGLVETIIEAAELRFGKTHDPIAEATLRDTLASTRLASFVNILKRPAN